MSMNLGDSGGIFTVVVEVDAWRTGIRLHWNLPIYTLV